MLKIIKLTAVTAALGASAYMLAIAASAWITVAGMLAS